MECDHARLVCWGSSSRGNDDDRKNDFDDNDDDHDDGCDDDGCDGDGGDGDGVRIDDCCCCSGILSQSSAVFPRGLRLLREQNAVDSCIEDVRPSHSCDRSAPAASAVSPLPLLLLFLPSFLRRIDAVDSPVRCDRLHHSDSILGSRAESFGSPSLAERPDA